MLYYIYLLTCFVKQTPATNRPAPRNKLRRLTATCLQMATGKLLTGHPLMDRLLRSQTPNKTHLGILIHGGLIHSADHLDMSRVSLVGYNQNLQTSIREIRP